MSLDRNAEVRRLNEADTHIAEAERRITEQEALLDELRRDGRDTAKAVQLLRMLQETLEAFQGHRHIIVDTIARIDAGLM